MPAASLSWPCTSRRRSSCRRRTCRRCAPPSRDCSRTRPFAKDSARRPASTAPSATRTIACSSAWKRSTVRRAGASRRGRLELQPRRGALPGAGARPRAARRARPRIRPAEVRRVLVAHHLLLGDTLMLAPLLAKLRERHPHAQIVMTVRPALMPFFEPRPYAVQAMPFDPRDGASLDALLQDRSYDLALVPGDNRYSWLAAALDAAWIVAFAGDRPAHKSWMVDELIPYPDTPMALADMNAMLLEGPAPKPYAKGDWPAPPAAAFTAPSGRYAICHVGAGSPLRYWEPAKWRALAAELERRGYEVVWSAGPG